MWINLRKYFSLFFFCSFLTLLFPQTFSFAQNAAMQEAELASQYFQQGDIEKAENLYKELAQNPKNIPVIHNNYFELLLNKSDFATAETYIDRAIAQYPQNVLYSVDKALIYNRQQLENQKDKVLQGLLKALSDDHQRLRMSAQHLSRKNMYEEAIPFYHQARKSSGNESQYALEMATLFRMLNEKDKMIEEYLIFVNENPANISYVKNILQNFLTEEEDLKALEMLMYEKVQKSPENAVYSDMLIWINLQQHNFYGAFIQARAFDKRNQTQGNKTMEIGMIALENNAYDDALQIFDYLVKQFPSTTNGLLAKRYRIKSREELVKNTFPVEKIDIEELITDYQELIAETGYNNTTLEALRSKALLHAFYLDELDTAMSNLQMVVEASRGDTRLRDRAKLDLGDLFILKQEPWESTLLYSQVEKSQKNELLGYEAKFKNAKLSFYKGDFELAKEHLDVLKLATTREIANDALDLSLLIQDNIFMDSTRAALKTYAAADLLLFRQKHDDALHLLDSIVVTFEHHNIIDEALFKSAEIQIRKGNFEEAVDNLVTIIEKFPKDVLADNAHYLIAEIYELHLKDQEKAMEYYQALLTTHPGSVFVADARKRFRNLRGDMLN